jgi:hypothetical protein
MDVLHFDRFSNFRPAQHFDLLEPFATICGIKLRILSRMAAQLRNARLEFPQQADQSVNTDRRGAWCASVGLSIKTAAIPHISSASPQGHGKFVGHTPCDGQGRLMQMNVLMRIDVRGHPTGKAQKLIKLEADFRLDGPRIVQRHALIAGMPLPAAASPLAKVYVQSKVEPPCIKSGVPGRRPANHQAGACDNAIAMGTKNAVVDAFTLAEVISVDDQGWLHGYIPMSSSSFAATFSAAKYSSAIALAALQCLL